MSSTTIALLNKINLGSLAHAATFGLAMHQPQVFGRPVEARMGFNIPGPQHVGFHPKMLELAEWLLAHGAHEIQALSRVRHDEYRMQETAIGSVLASVFPNTITTTHLAEELGAVISLVASGNALCLGTYRLAPFVRPLDSVQYQCRVLWSDRRASILGPLIDTPHNVLSAEAERSPYAPRTRTRSRSCELVITPSFTPPRPHTAPPSSVVAGYHLDEYEPHAPYHPIHNHPRFGLLAPLTISHGRVSRGQVAQAVEPVGHGGSSNEASSSSDSGASDRNASGASGSDGSSNGARTGDCNTNDAASNDAGNGGSDASSSGSSSSNPCSSGSSSCDRSSGSSSSNSDEEVAWR